MDRRRLKTLVGLAMVGLGLFQMGLYAVQSEWIPMGLGTLYSAIGFAYLWIEVYTVGQ